MAVIGQDYGKKQYCAKCERETWHLEDTSNKPTVCIDCAFAH